MSQFYDRMAATALSLLKAYGKLIPIARPGGTHDAPSGVVTPGAGTTGNIFAAVFPANTSKKDLFDNSIEDGTMIGKEIRYVVAAASGAPFEPKSNDILSFNSASWRVVGCNALAPDGTPVIYQMGVVKV
jgi:hypothetical protein